MIVYQRSLVLSQDELDQPLTHPRICYENYLAGRTADAVVVSGETDEGPRDGPLTSDTVFYWKPPSLPATWQGDMGRARTIDYGGLAGHTLGSMGCAVVMETSTNTTDWEQFGDEIAPGYDDPLVFLDNPRVCRWVRWGITGGEDLPQIAVAKAGLALAMPKRVSEPWTPLNLSRVTELTRAKSRGGQFVGQSFKRHGVTGAARFQFLDQTFVRDTFDLFIKHARGEPYFFCWNPEEYPREVAYVQSDQDIVPRYMSGIPDMEVTIPMHGIGSR